MDSKTPPPDFDEFFKGLKARAEKTDEEKVKEAFKLLSLKFPPKK